MSPAHGRVTGSGTNAVVKNSSRIPGFYKLGPAERLSLVGDFATLTDAEMSMVRQGHLCLSDADHMIENVVGAHALPLGIAVNFLINGRDYLIPMAVEEPSVVAGASFAARLARLSGGFQTNSDPPIMIGQIQVLGMSDPYLARFELLRIKPRILDLANEQDPLLVSLGGGAKDLEVRVVSDSPVGPMVIVHVLYDCRDAMGANTVNTAVEAVAPLVETATGGRVNLRIISNLADRRLARATCVVPVGSLEHEEFRGEDVVTGIIEAYAMAMSDPYRAATHNKGIMNGIDAVVLATGNDWRAIEAGAHAYAARSGHYAPLTSWSANRNGDLVGTIELPLAVGMVGGATKVHPTARVALKILGVNSASELAEVIAAVGLAQNLAALRALAAEGIQRGHMALHARQLAMAAGASGEELDLVIRRLVAEVGIRLDRAEEILREVRAQTAREKQ